MQCVQCVCVVYMTVNYCRGLISNHRLQMRNQVLPLAPVLKPTVHRPMPSHWATRYERTTSNAGNGYQRMETALTRNQPWNIKGHFFPQLVLLMRFAHFCGCMAGRDAPTGAVRLPCLYVVAHNSPPCILPLPTPFFFNTIHTKCFSGWFLIILNAFCSQPLLNQPEPANYSERYTLMGGGICVRFFLLSSTVLIFLWLPLILTRSAHSRRPCPVPT